jgi:hypothetical protein
MTDQKGIDKPENECLSFLCLTCGDDRLFTFDGRIKHPLLLPIIIMVKCKLKQCF